MLSWLALLAMPAGAQTRVPDSPGIPWSEDRPLEWSDFQGEVDPNAPAETVAATAASLQWSYRYERVAGRRGPCIFRITGVETAAEFHPRDSWVKPGYRTDHVLSHEQGHFDLTQIHKLMLDRAVRGIVGVERPCPGRDATMADIEAAAAELVTPVGEGVWRDLGRVQDRYDGQTGHGMDAAAQREWSARIARALARGRWQ